MTRTKLSDRSLPYYTPAEETFNAVSHIIGGALSAGGMLACISVSLMHHSGYELAASLIYGISNILLYTMSSIYHGLPQGTAKKVFQVLDHCTIYIMIAGTYTIIAMCGIARISASAAITLLIVEWTLAALAITLNAIDLRSYRTFAMIANLVMGWAVLPMYKIVMAALTPAGFWYILGGGIIYTIGAVLYAIGSRKSYMHCVFHVFVLAGSILHFIGIFLYVL